MNTILDKPRNSVLQLNEVYFWTDTVKDWKHLLAHNAYKELIVDSLNYLVQRKKIVVYGFVIMPNHIHLLWEMLAKNGKETAYASFNKIIAHQITKDLMVNRPWELKAYSVAESTREHRIWQRDPLGILMDYRKKFEQKLRYIHNNPLQAHWNLSKTPEGYFWSSARFYYTGKDEFGFLTHYKERFG